MTRTSRTRCVARVDARLALRARPAPPASPGPPDSAAASRRARARPPVQPFLCDRPHHRRLAHSPREELRNAAAQTYEGSSSGGEDSTTTSSIEDEPRLSKKRVRQDEGAVGRKIWMRPCNECGEELHVRRTRCTACGATQVSKRAITSTKEVDGADQEAALGLASFAGASQVSSATPSPEPRRIELTPEQRIKLLRLRKLQILLALAPSVAPAPLPGGVAMLSSVACAR